MFVGAHFCTRCGTPLGRATPDPGVSAIASALSIEEVDRGFDFGDAKSGESIRASAVNGNAAVSERASARAAADLAGEAPVNEEVNPMSDYSRDEVMRRVRMKQSLKRAGLNGINLSGANLENADLSRAELEGANLDGANLKGAQLQNASLREASLKGADLTQANLDRADLSGAKLSGAILDRASLKRASIEGANLNGASLIGACLSGAELTFAMLNRAVLRNADLASAVLQKADLTSANCEGAQFGGADFTAAILLEAIFARAAFQDADLSRVDARRASFERAALDRANFADTNLDGALLHGARLTLAALARMKSGGRPHVAHILGVDRGSAEQRLEGEAAWVFLRGEVTAAGSTTRYFGKGDVLRDALLEFGAGSKIRIDSRFENCTITLGDGAELVIGEAGVLRNCQIAGYGDITIDGCFFQRQSPGISGARSVVVTSKGAVSGAVEQRIEPTRFAFEPGCRLRVKITPMFEKQAAE
jgi:uncharacterized protein YjbI with pentapeptide repeats